MAISSDIMVPSHAETRILSNGMAITIHLHLAFSYEGHIHHGSFHEYFHMIQLNNNNRLPPAFDMHVYEKTSSAFLKPKDAKVNATMIC